jgi:tetratricopeptide (TPR) repeat protein
LARAESLLVTGHLESARTVLEGFVRRHDRDPDALTLLGRVHLAWPVIGRFKAWHLFEQAASLRPTDPEPRYWQARVGLFLGGADGEAIARRAVQKVWELVPVYQNTWGIWTQLFRNDKHRRHAVALLSRHRGHPTADLRRAQLLIELEQWREADAVLRELIRRGHDSAWLWALRAQGALEAQDTTNGLAYYRRALERAATDSTDALWSQIAAIASLEEDSTYHATPLENRADFFRAFWARREPDLTTETNERIAEHFERLRYVRRTYSLLHPLSSFHHSPIRRALTSALAGEIALALRSSGFATTLLRGHGRFADSLERLGMSVDVRDVPEPDSLTRYRRFGLDGRGLLYLRFGKPDQIYLAGGRNLGDIEAWRFSVDGRSVVVPFARATAVNRFGAGGDMVLYPTNRRDLSNGIVLLDTDATSLDGDREMQVWLATFRGTGRDQHVVYLRASIDTVAAAIWDGEGREFERQRGAGPRAFSLRSGRYAVGIDARDSEGLARIRGSVTVPWLWGDQLTLSSILVGASGQSLTTREDVARAMPGNLEFPVASPLALYTEIYNLPATSEGIAEFEVEYRFEPIGRGRPVTFAFSRRAAAEPSLVERIVLEPDRVPAGQYRIVLTVRDRLFGVAAQTSRVDVHLR